MKKYDVAIIGAGPAGITAAIYLSRANINCCIIEKDTPGGIINKSSMVENYLGYESISGPDLAYKFYEQLKETKIPYIFGEVKEIIDGKTKKLILNDEEIEVRKVIIAVGRSTKKLPVKYEDRLEGKGISFCSLCDGSLYKNEDVAIVGAGNSALEEALYLSDICKNVTILYRGTNMRGDKTLIERIENKQNINVLLNTEVKEFVEENSKLKGVILSNDKFLNIKACFIFIGYEPATSFLKKLDILDEKGYINVDERKETCVKGIYAAGDIVKKDAYQIITASSDGVIAATSCIKDLSFEE